MRSRPASLTAAAPPSSCQDTHRVNPVSTNPTSTKGRQVSASFAPSDQRSLTVLITAL